MQFSRELVVAAAAFTAAACAPASQSGTTDQPATTAAGASRTRCETAGLMLPPGFCATVFADSVGSARHMVVAPNGDVFVNVQRARPNSPVSAIGPGVAALRDTNGDGVADQRAAFGDSGNTGIGLHGGYLYQDIGTAIVRWPLPAGSLRPSGPREVVVGGLPYLPGHRARNFAIAPNGTLYVNVGSATNACQQRDRQNESRGVDPCTELQTRAGIWVFDANRTGQTFSAAARFATGIRNATGLAVEPSTGEVYAASHGRDQLHQNWPTLFTAEQNAELPAEELLHVRRGDDFGWPYCYWDSAQNRRVLAPEYGGNGREVGRCVDKKGPAVAMPAHWAPNALTFYTASAFPARYRGGAFVAMHGSWNRAPLRQEGYRVLFVPFANGRPSAGWEDFASGFSGENPTPQTAPHRPTGVAVGRDGALYVSDDVGGRIWRITYSGRD